jgi:hypothetical protein
VVEGGFLTPSKEAFMKAPVKTKRLKKTMCMVAWICLFYAGLHFPMSSALGGQHIQQFQGVIIAKDTANRVIYVNEMKVVVPKGAEIRTARDVRLSFESLRAKEWVFIQARPEGKHLVADRIVRIPRYIPPMERGKYQFFTQTGDTK